MSNNIEDIKRNLQQLCNEYIDILEKLKSENIIEDEIFESCTASKKLFLDE